MIIGSGDGFQNLFHHSGVDFLVLQVVWHGNAFWMVTLKAHILPHPDLQPPGCRGSSRSQNAFARRFIRQKQKKRIMLSSEMMIWQPEFTGTFSKKIGVIQSK